MRECERRLPWLVAWVIVAGLACDPGATASRSTEVDPTRAVVEVAETEETAERVEIRDPQAPGPVRPARPLDYLHDYRFEDDWFTHNIPVWAALLEPYAGRRGVRYLEVGLWQGRSFLWMLDHILTGPNAHATGVDIAIKQVLLDNIEKSGAADRVRIIEGFSQVELRSLPVPSYDIVYIDGSHTAAHVMEDLVLAWRLLEPGGLMILDDYLWNGFRDPERPPLPEELLPRIAIDAFISTHRNEVEVVHKAYQMVLRKSPFGCPHDDSKCSRLGAYAYAWDQKLLYRDGGEVALSESERELVEALIRGKRGDALAIDLDPALHGSGELWSLSDRLGLRLR